MSKTVRVGVMPGRIYEVAVELGTSIQEVIQLAGLNTNGYDVKVDGEKADPDTTFVSDSTNLVLLVKQVKGNANGMVRVGVMPGRIQEVAVELGASIQDVIELAGLSTEGYDVKVDGEKVDPDTAVVTESTNLVLLVKQVKGN